MPMPDMVPFRFCALNVTGLCSSNMQLKPDMSVNHTAIGDFLRTVVPPDVSADVVVSAVSACPNPLLHSLTAFMHCLRAAFLPNLGNGSPKQVWSLVHGSSHQQATIGSTLDDEM
ncbi:hypothetical protein E2C01_000765 [Portunus trituberculatus]|uniref:Uncharacterized protein n=1 Tax=Portunus trituberculatus TaxID=210409 RepID=A0A5B7CG05_PORTR|nr:hypothetical protein [Portunus trituberculatus]